jgi:hypothetical protein
MAKTNAKAAMLVVVASLVVALLFANPARAVTPMPHRISVTTYTTGFGAPSAIRSTAGTIDYQGAQELP